MSYRWQYDAHVEPLATTRAAQVDKWNPEVDQPPKARPRLATAILMAAAVLVPIVTAPPAETITVDKWYQPLTTPVRIVPRLNAGFTALHPVPITVAPTIREWNPELPDLPPRRAKALPAATLQGRSQFFVQTEIPLPTFLPLSEPVWVKRRPLNPGIQVIHPVPFPSLLVPNMESWEPRLVVPTPPRKPQVAVGLQTIDPIALKLPEPAQIDKWGQPVQLPPRGRSPLVPVGWTVVHPLPLPTLFVPPQASWEPRIVVPVPPRKPLLQVGLTVIDPTALNLPEPIRLDKWYVPLSVPVRRQHLNLRHSEQFAPVFVPVAIPRLDSWESRVGL